MSILLVCNEPSFRVVLGDLLREQGYEVDACRDLDGAKRQLHHREYELVILNLLDGVDTALHACRQLRNTRPDQKLAFIRGRWAQVPPEACPHYLVPLHANPKDFLADVAALVSGRSQSPGRASDSLEHHRRF